MLRRGAARGRDVLRVLFFFSSRRRHTRCSRDWSSDVCSSDLYPWKILTGRNDRLPTLRQPGGLSGFLRRSESPHDQFGAGHAGTGLSAAYGIAAARDLAGEQFKVVAVVGDGALTCGLPYEAMNN